MMFANGRRRWVNEGAVSKEFSPKLRSLPAGNLESINFVAVFKVVANRKNRSIATNGYVIVGTNT
jgi:hypothetical protein